MATTATIATNHGDIRINLFPDQAPKTVRNFTGLAEGTQEWTDPKVQAKSTAPLYDGTIFHRIIPDFIVQGGKNAEGHGRQGGKRGKRRERQHTGVPTGAKGPRAVHINWSSIGDSDALAERVFVTLRSMPTFGRSTVWKPSQIAAPRSRRLLTGVPRVASMRRI